MVTVGESASGGVQVVVNNTITLNKSPALVAALYQDVGENLFSVSNYVFKMCDSYYFGGIWANVESSTFLKKNPLCCNAINLRMIFRYLLTMEVYKISYF